MDGGGGIGQTKGTGGSPAGTGGRAATDERVLLGPGSDSKLIEVGEDYRLVQPCPTTQGDQNPELRYPTSLLAAPDGMPLLLCRGAVPNLMGGVVKLDADGALDVYVTGDILVTAMAQTSEGDVILGGVLPTPGKLNEYDAAIAMYDDEGVLLWSDSWEAGPRSRTEAIAVARDGSIYATGDAVGVAPGNPDTATGGRWIARYEPNGDRMWIKQYPKYASTSNPNFVSQSTIESGIATLVVAPSGKLYAAGAAGDADWLETFDADGELTAHTMAPPNRVGSDHNLDYLTLAADEASLYFARGRLMNLGLDGALNWSAALDTHPGPSDADEPAQPGIGGIAVGAPILVDEKSMYLVGSYSADSHSALAYLGHYDPEGERRWVQQYELTDGVVNLSIARRPDGNLLVLARLRNSPGEGFTGTYLFQVNADDGSLR